MNEEHYDYIIAGTGCAGLSLVVHLIRSGQFANKKLLLIDQDKKQKNDRTWCFWEKKPGIFQSVVYKEWTQLLFKNDNFRKELRIEPYTYKLIQGGDFYKYCFEIINANPNITFLQGSIDDIFSSDGVGVVIAGGKKFTAQYVFNSIFSVPKLNRKEYWLHQHFRGWKIKTPKPAFDSNVATLMDFSTDQHNGTTFFYVLPFSETEALIEFTLFSESLLDDDKYESALQNYIKNTLGITQYDIVERENGIIPMTNVRFSPGNDQIVNIGTAGGQTKGSSGYTFNFTQKHSAAIVECLKQDKNPLQANQHNRRHHFYDSVLLNILHHKTLPGDHIFTELWRKNAAAKVLEFLDNESTIGTELQIITSLPILPFSKAALSELL